jgi:hypothetical protein
MKLAMTLVPLFAGLVFSQETTRTETTTTTWNGTLVDEGCRTTRTKETTSNDRKTETKTTVVTECPVALATTSFGLLTVDGKYIRFDPASNARIVEMVKNNREWTTYVTERKPIKTRVIGTINGDVVVIKEIGKNDR